MAKPLTVERAYECLFITPTDTPQKTIDTFIEKIKSTLAPTKGVLRGVQFWGRRRLTYSIKHQKEGNFIFLDYTGENASNEALKVLFRVTDFVLRHLITDKVVLNPPVVRKPPSEGGADVGAATAAPVTAATAATTATSVDVQTKTPPSA